MWLNKLRHCGTHSLRPLSYWASALVAQNMVSKTMHSAWELSFCWEISIAEKSVLLRTWFWWELRFAENSVLLSSENTVHNATFTFWGIKRSSLKMARILKIEACGQTVLPDRSILRGGKCQNENKCDILSDFQTLWHHLWITPISGPSFRAGPFGPTHFGPKLPISGPSHFGPYYSISGQGPFQVCPISGPSHFGPVPFQAWSIKLTKSTVKTKLFSREKKA